MSSAYFQTWTEPTQSFADPVTGRLIKRWTAVGAASQHLYFTSHSVTADDRWLVFLSDRSGTTNLYALERHTALCHRLTDNRQGTRIAYCYPYGGPRGLARPTVSLDPHRNRLYTLIDDTVIRIDLDTGVSRALWTIPPNSMPAFTHVSPDGAYLAVPLTNADAFSDRTGSQLEQMDRIATHIDAGKVHTTLYLIDTDTGAARPWFEVPFWLTHVQFDPTGSGWVIFNSEGLWERQVRIPRLWAADPSGAYRPVVVQKEGERLGHENFAADGTIVYHGYAPGREYIARRHKTGELIEELTSPTIPVHHTTPDASGQGYIVDSNDGGIYHVLPDGAGGTAATLLCRHDTELLAEQDNHAHPIAPPRGASVLFTAFRRGDRGVFEVDVGSVEV